MSNDNPFNAPGVSDWNSMPPQEGMVRIKRLGVASCAKTLGALYAVIGLVAGAIFSLVALLGVAANVEGPQAGMVFGGVLSIILFPFLYGIGGLLGGAFLAVLYNAAASFAGGIEINLG